MTGRHRTRQLAPRTSPPSLTSGLCVSPRRNPKAPCAHVQPDGRNRRSDRNQTKEHLVAQVSRACSPIDSHSDLFLTSGTLQTLLEPGKSFLHQKPPTKLCMSFHSLVGTEMVPAPPPPSPGAPDAGSPAEIQDRGRSKRPPCKPAAPRAWL